MGITSRHERGDVRKCELTSWPRWKILIRREACTIKKIIRTSRRCRGDSEVLFLECKVIPLERERDVADFYALVKRMNII